MATRNSTATPTLDSFGYEVVPEPPKPTATNAKTMPPEEADALMAALKTGWVKAPGVYETRDKAASAAWRVRDLLLRAGKIKAVKDIERRIVEEDGKFIFILGKRSEKK